MSNSSLVVYTQISPNKSKRKGKICKITPHHMAGNCSIEACGKMFANPSRQGSSNYGIGTDGRIAMYVPECYRAWTSSNRENDDVAITIEVANDGGAPNWHVSDKALASLIDLCVDICKRNGIEKLVYTGDKTGNLTKHEWFANTTCPGPYLGGKFPYIAEEVNKRLNPETEKTEDKSEDTLYRVQVGAYSHLENAKNQEKKAKTLKFDTYLVKVGDLYKVQLGAFKNKPNADKLLAQAKSAGFTDAFITTEAGNPVTDTVTNPKTLEKGSKVRIKKGAKSYEGSSMASFVYDKVYTVDELKGERAVLDKNGICTAFNVKDLILVD